MSLTLTLLLSLQVATSSDTVDGQKRTSVSVRLPVNKLTVVTEEQRRTAFKDPQARDLLLRARKARLTQDSAIQSYVAKSYQRISVGMSLRERARERLAFRMENASRVEWKRNVGAHVEVLGARAVVPIVAGIKEAEDEMKEDPDLDDLFAIPYYPGMDELWLFRLIGNSNDSTGHILVHPIAEGSEAYFTFETGDSVTMGLPDGTRISLRELRVIPRKAKWNLVVGSLWFEVERANLVRAVLRFSSTMDIWQVAKDEAKAEGEEDPGEDVPKILLPLFGTMQGELSALTIEYGLLEQRFWLPRLQGAEFWAKVSLMRMPIKIEQRYRYESVNTLTDLAAINIPAAFDADTLRDRLRGLGLDSVAVRDSVRQAYALRDSLEKVDRDAQCAATGSHIGYQRGDRSDMPIRVSVPCDQAKLEHSSELPPSIYDAGEELFGAKDREELLKALDFGLQPGWAPQAPSLTWGLSQTRFNRVEGFSSGALIKSTLGKGYTSSLLARGSVGDLQLNGEFTLSRSNGRSVVGGTVYRRLVVSSDFGDPFTLGASLGALLYARDEGFYHRAWGAELSGGRPLENGLAWRLFSEQQWNAPVENEWSLFGGAHDDRLGPNVTADRVWLHGAAIDWSGGRGLDPAGWRLSSRFRLEGATGDLTYGRGLVEATVSRGLGPVAASLTGAIGTTEGEVPAQRQFFLGGLQSVRGQSAGTAVGESFWLSRLEVGTNVAAVRPVIFGDLGWAGARNDWGTGQRPLAGVGTGMSFLDGMIRIDLARGIHPRWQTRLDLYLEARF